MSINKRYFKSKPTCKVTFTIDAAAQNSAREAHLVGEFNDWSVSATPMKPLKKGGFKADVELEKDRAYQFRYLLDRTHWDNDPAADDLAPTPFAGSYNSVVVL